MSFVLRIKGRGAFEEQGSYVFFMYIMTKINACYHATVQVICFSIVWQIDNSLSRAFLNIAQCTIGIDCASTSLFGQWRRLFFSYNFTILQFSYNFSLVVANCFFFYFLFCLFHFVFSRLTNFTKHFINIFNAGTAKSATTNAYFADIGVPIVNL